MKQGKIVAIIIIFVAAIVAAYIVVNRYSTITIKGRVVGVTNQTIYLDRYNGTMLEGSDSVKLSASGDFRFNISSKRSSKITKSPALYELRCGWERVPLLACRGDKIVVNAIGSMNENYTVKGSLESELLRTFYQKYQADASELKKIASEYAMKQENEEKAREVAVAYNTLYTAIKQFQLQFIIGNKSSMAAIYALMQRLPGDVHLINENSDLIYMRTVAEAVEELYPDAPLLNYVKRLIDGEEQRVKLLSQIEESDFPEIVMNDRFGKSVALSSLKGNVILLDFWSAELGSSNQNNARLKELYSTYKSRGFEVYQVGIDNSKTQWINAIQIQRLPWISVSDLRGGNSSALSLYNISTIPANLLISKDGNIVGRNLYGDELGEAIEREVRVNTPLERAE